MANADENLILGIFKMLEMVIVSATLSGVETLKYPPFHGICFFFEVFSFFSLVGDFLEQRQCQDFYIFVFDDSVMNYVFQMNGNKQILS